MFSLPLFPLLVVLIRVHGRRIRIVLPGLFTAMALFGAVWSTIA